jgi:predicted transposase YbfD/YdcC
MYAKGNQPELERDIKLLFERATSKPAVLTPIECLSSQRVVAHSEPGKVADSLNLRCSNTSNLGHGRIEQRVLECLSLPDGALNWPGAKQVFRLRRNRKRKKSGITECEVVYGVTSLSAEEASSDQLLCLCRGHWSIENRSHHTRDVTFDEDRSTVRTGAMPQLMAAMRNTALNLLRLTGVTNVAAARRSYAWQPHRVIPLLTQACTFE